MAELNRVAVDDDYWQQAHPGDPEMLALDGSTADFTLAADTQRTIERVAGLALVEAVLGSTR